MSNVVPLVSNPIFNEHIPQEIERTIVSFLPFREIMRGARTCRGWQSLIPTICKEAYAQLLCGSEFYKKAYGVHITEEYDPDNVPLEFAVRVFREFVKLGSLSPDVKILPILCVIPKEVRMPDGRDLPFNLQIQEQFSKHPQEGYRRAGYSSNSTWKDETIPFMTKSYVEQIDTETVKTPYLACLAIQKAFSKITLKEKLLADGCPALPTVTIMRNWYASTGNMPFDNTATNEHRQRDCYLLLSEIIQTSNRLQSGHAIIRMFPPSETASRVAEIEVSENHEDPFMETVVMEGGVLKFFVGETPLPQPSR